MNVNSCIPDSSPVLLAGRWHARIGYSYVKGAFCATRARFSHLLLRTHDSMEWEIAWNIAFAIRYDGIRHATQHGYISLLFSSLNIFSGAQREIKR